MPPDKLDRGGLISLHRLLQEVIRDSIKELGVKGILRRLKRLFLNEEQQAWIDYCILVLNERVDFDFSTEEKRAEFQALSPHVSAVTEWGETTRQEERAGLFHFLGYGSGELAIYEEALEWYGKDLAISEKALGKEHPNTQTVRENAASAYAESGRSQPFEEWFKGIIEAR